MSASSAALLEPDVREALDQLWPSAHVDVDWLTPAVARITPRRARSAAATAPASAILKMPSPDPGVRAFKEGLGLPAVERDVYRRVHGTPRFRLPRLYDVVEVETGGAAVLHEDLGDSLTFAEFSRVIREILVSLGEFHGSTWEAPTDWLPAESDTRRIDALAALWEPGIVENAEWAPKEVRQEDARLGEAFVDVFRRLGEFPSGMSHGDLHRGNVSYRYGVAAAWDWEAASCGAGMLDVVCLATDCDLPLALAIDAYRSGLRQAGVEPPSDVLDRCADLSLLAHLLKRAALSGGWAHRLPDDVGMRSATRQVVERGALRFVVTP